MEERRHHTRLSSPIDASWRGSSGANTGRVNDISASGCFIQSLANPSPGESTEITLTLAPGDTLAVKGHVVYAEHGMGFAVAFDDVPAETIARLQAFIGTRQGR